MIKCCASCLPRCFKTTFGDRTDIWPVKKTGPEEGEDHLTHVYLENGWCKKGCG